jgi:transcriptional regulator with XRE-family HTH domain
MRTPARKHVLCILREILGLTQKQLGQLVGVARPTIQGIELGSLSLSDHVAQRISEETGISIHWLRSNVLSRRPVNRSSRPYTVKDFSLAQTGMFRGTYFVELMPMVVALNAYAKLRAIVEALNFNEATMGPFPLKLEMAILELEDCITDPAAREKYFVRRGKTETENLDDVIKLIRTDLAHLLQAKRDAQRQNAKTRQPSKVKVVVPNYPNVLEHKPTLVPVPEPERPGR